MNESLTTEYWDMTTESLNASGFAESLNASGFAVSAKEPLTSPLVEISFVIVGTAGNILVCLAIYLNSKLHNLTNFFLFSLAVTDLLMDVFILPANVLVYVYPMQPSIFPLCFSYAVGNEFLSILSSLHICSISIDRYIAIKNPMAMRNLRKKRMYKKIGLVWLISLFSIIPYTTMIAITEHPTTEEYCLIVLSKLILVKLIVYVECFVMFLMTVVVVVSFIGTTLALRKQTKPIAGGPRSSMILVRNIGRKKTPGNDPEGAKASPKKVNTEKKALKVVWLVSFAFIIAMGPYTIVSLIYLSASPSFIVTYLFHPHLVKLVIYLKYTNSVINPIIYTIFNKEFRDSFKQIIMFNCKKLRVKDIKK